MFKIKGIAINKMYSMCHKLFSVQQIFFIEITTTTTTTTATATTTTTTTTTTIIVIIIMFINCNWVVTRWQWLFYMYTNMR